CDVVIAGAGIVGLSVAWQLARRSSLKVTVIDKGAGVGEGSTGASSAICRHRYSSDRMVSLARAGIAAYRNWPRFTGLADPAARFHGDGVLWLPGRDTAWAPREHARLRELDVPTAVLDDAGLKERFPALNPSAVQLDAETGEVHACEGGGQHLLELDGGFMEPVAAAQDLVSACRGAGVDVRFGQPVTDVLTEGGAVSGVGLGDGTRIAAPLLVNATGPWCQRLFAAAGVPPGWDLAPVRIQVLYLDRPDRVEGAIPVVADFETGIYFRTQNRGQQFVLGSVLKADERERVADPDRLQTVHDDEFQYAKLHLLQFRIPALPNRGRVRGYCGLYTTNMDDMHPILGPTALEGFWAANGFSGHGFKLAPAVGAMLARAITGEALADDPTVPLDFLAVDRAPIDVDAKNVLA
ncbi:MAG: FAD-dependent oxidoreductase, partial [Pseudomonadota bacterium]